MKGLNTKQINKSPGAGPRVHLRSEFSSFSYIIKSARKVSGWK